MKESPITATALPDVDITIERTTVIRVRVPGQAVRDLLPQAPEGSDGRRDVRALVDRQVLPDFARLLGGGVPVSAVVSSQIVLDAITAAARPPALSGYSPHPDSAGLLQVNDAAALDTQIATALRFGICTLKPYLSKPGAFWMSVVHDATDWAFTLHPAAAHLTRIWPPVGTSLIPAPSDPACDPAGYRLNPTLTEQLRALTTLPPVPHPPKPRTWITVSAGDRLGHTL